jgi:hypothetical protein
VCSSDLKRRKGGIPNVWFVYGQVTDMQYKGKDTNNANDDGT